jgi:hypothetical protein
VLDIKVDELLPIDNRDAQLLGLRRVKQHSLHFRLPPRSHTTRDGRTYRALLRAARNTEGVQSLGTIMVKGDVGYRFS